MPDVDGASDTKDFHLEVPAKNEAFVLKGSGALGWGLQNRLARIFNPASGRTVMLAFDHGYFKVPTPGLARMNITIFALCPYADALICTLRALRLSLPS